MTDAIKITKQHADFVGLRWAALAKAKDDMRYYLNYLYVEPGGRVIGSDGHRMHTYKPAGDWLEPGYYTVRKLTTAQILLEPEAVDATYPDWQGVLYARNEPGMLWISLQTSPDVALYQIIRELDACMQYRYAMEALSLSEMSASRPKPKGERIAPWSLEAAREKKAGHMLYLRCGEAYRAVVAGLRTDIKDATNAA